MAFDPDAYLRERGDSSSSSSDSGTWWGAVKSGAQTADDIVRAAANAATFGMADRIAGWMPGSTVDEEVRRSEEARARSPIASVAGDVAGSVALPGLGGARLATSLGGRFGGRAVGYGLEGAGIGAAQGAGNTYTGKPEDYINNAATGFVTGGLTGGLVGGAIGPRPMTSAAPRPSVAQQDRFVDARYADLRNNPTRYSPGHFGDVADRVENVHMRQYDPAYTPASRGALERMRNTDPVTPGEVDFIRQSTRKIPGVETVDQEAAGHVRRALDDFIINPPAGSVLTNPAVAREAGAIATEAREAKGALERSKILQNIRDAAEGKASSTYSGLNFENTVRQMVQSDLLNPRSTAAVNRLAGFTAPERAALRNVVSPGLPADTLRYIGNFMGAGGGLGAYLTSAGAGGYGGYASDDKATGALIAAATLAGGLGLRKGANVAASRRLQRAQDLVSERSPLFQQWARTAPMVRSGGMSPATTQAARDLVTLELLKRHPAEE